MRTTYKVYSVFCDGDCGDSLESDASKDDLARQMLADGWVRRGRKDYCVSCASAAAPASS